MSASDAPDWTPDSPQTNLLKPGAQSWTMTGAPCGPFCPNLSEAQKTVGFTFATLCRIDREAIAVDQQLSI